MKTKSSRGSGSPEALTVTSSCAFGLSESEGGPEQGSWLKAEGSDQAASTASALAWPEA